MSNEVATMSEAVPMPRYKSFVTGFQNALEIVLPKMSVTLLLKNPALGFSGVCYVIPAAAAKRL